MTEKMLFLSINIDIIQVYVEAITYKLNISEKLKNNFDMYISMHKDPGYPGYTLPECIQDEIQFLSLEIKKIKKIKKNEKI
jgi:hypothetical protein